MSKEHKGNLIAFLNRQRDKGKDRPAFQGKITLPGKTDERGFALWTYTSAGGDVVLSGRALQDATSQIEMLANPDRPLTDATIELAQRDGGTALSIKAHTMVLFTNKQKTAETQSRPDFWGYFNPGGSDPLMRLGVWAKTDRSGAAMLTGEVTADDPTRQKDPLKLDRDIDDAPPPEYERTHDMSM